MRIIKLDSAFTLIELIIVTVIIGIISIIAIARWPGTKINLNAQAQQLASDVRYIQSLSMSQGVRYRLNFISSTSYSFSDINGNVVNNYTTGQTTTTLQSGITLTLPPTNLPNNVITFDSQGTPYIDNAGTTALASTAIISFVSGSNTSTVSITPQTGRVTVP